MKKFLYVAMLAVLPLTAMAQHEEDTENGVVSLAGREGFTIETKKGDFVLLFCRQTDSSVFLQLTAADTF